MVSLEVQQRLGCYMQFAPKLCMTLISTSGQWYLHSFSPLHVSLIADYLFKFLVIGNAGVGKSCLLHQFIEQKCE